MVIMEEFDDSEFVKIMETSILAILVLIFYVVGGFILYYKFLDIKDLSTDEEDDEEERINKPR